MIDGQLCSDKAAIIKIARNQIAEHLGIRITTGYMSVYYINIVLSSGALEEIREGPGKLGVNVHMFSGYSLRGYTPFEDMFYVPIDNKSTIESVARYISDFIILNHYI